MQKVGEGFLGGKCTWFSPADMNSSYVGVGERAPWDPVDPVFQGS